MKEQVERAVEVLKQGGIILYPTDTVWGIGCDATNKEAVAKIYDLKKSENKKAMIVLCHSLDMVARYIQRPPHIAMDLMEVADTPLTVIMQGGVGVAQNLIPEEGTLAVRVADHKFCQALTRRLGKPIVSTSANISGDETPTTFATIDRAIIDGVDMVIDPRFEGHPTGTPSSIIMFDADESFKIIR